MALLGDAVDRFDRANSVEASAQGGAVIYRGSES